MAWTPPGLSSVGAPMADQLLPLHLAMPLGGGTPPADVKPPPTYTSLPLTSIAATTPPSPGGEIPVPRADQPTPSHFAIFAMSAPPAVVKNPPANRLVPLRARVVTPRPIPLPSADQR